MKLKDYAEYENLFFMVEFRAYYTDIGASKESIGARNWETNELEWLDPETEVQPLDLPPRPMPPPPTWFECHATLRSEMQYAFQKYVRQMEMYANAVTNILLKEAESE